MGYKNERFLQYKVAIYVLTRVRQSHTGKTQRILYFWELIQYYIFISLLHAQSIKVTSFMFTDTTIPPEYFPLGKYKKIRIVTLSF